jgi:hypothetical protein
VRQAWVDRYGPLVGEQLQPTQRYSLLRVGAAEFAYSTYERYVSALAQAWDAGLVPQSLRAVDGAQLLEAAPNLRGVDLDLTGLQASDVERLSRFS